MSLSSLAKKVIIILFVTIIALFISLPHEFSLLGKKFTRPNLDINAGRLQIHKNFDLVLGLDLAGGSHLVFEADTGGISLSAKKDALDSLKSTIEQRVNFFGVSEPNIQLSSFGGKDRIIVELPGVKDTKSAVGLIGQTAKLEFREFIDPSQATASAIPTLENTRPTGLTGSDFEKATSGFDTNISKPIVEFRIKSGESAEKFGEVTTRLIGKPMAIFLDDIPISWPTVQSTITDSGQITGNFSVEGTKQLSKLLNAGAITVPIKLVEERTVGATLGADSVAKSVKAGLVVISIVLLFMVLAYGIL